MESRTLAFIHLFVEVFEQKNESESLPWILLVLSGANVHTQRTRLLQHKAEKFRVQHINLSVRDILFYSFFT